MPFADVFDDGTVKLVPAAVFSAAAQLSGAHGALPVIPPAEKKQIIRTIDRIYDKFRTMWDDPRQVPPWERAPSPEEPVEASLETEATMPVILVDDEPITAAVRSSGWGGMPTSTGAWDEGAARRALDAWAGDDMAKYGRAFLWSDGSGNRTGFKFPIAKPVNGTLTVFLSAVNNADSRLSSADIPAADKAKIQGILDSIQDRYKKSVTAALGFAPPASVFGNPGFTAPTKPRVTDMGGWHMYQGHIAQWGVCHRGFKDSCILAPRSRSNYAEFKTGNVLTADGHLIDTGTITMNTGHAAHGLGLQAAVAHYDNTGLAAVAANVGEDAHGIWAAGVVMPGVDPATVFALRASAISGDWRWDGSNLELCAALAVNTPGFPVYEMTASGAEMMSLTAAGVVHGDDCGCGVAASVDVARLTEQETAIRTAAMARRQRRLLSIELPVRS